MLTAFRGTAAGALLTAAGLLAAPLTATAVPAASGAHAAEVVGGPDLAAAGVVVRPGPGSTPLPTVDADTWLVADLTTGQVLAAKGAHTRVLPASTLKTLTAVTLMPRLDKSQVVTATWAEARAGGGHVGIVPGATYTIWDLWHGLLLPSANDAAAALADANGGMAQTVAQMQAMARRLQADDTTVKNNSGLDAPGQLSSAYDMALIARAALALPDFQTVTRTVHYPFPGKPAAAGATRATYQIYTQNRLLLHGYPGTIGGKTGFTSLAHRTFWGAASRGGHTIVATLFQIHEPTETAARALLTWGLANTGKVTPVGTLVEPLDVPSAAASDGSAGTSAAGGGATSASAASPDSSGRAPWAPIVLVALAVALVGGGLLLGRRRRRQTPHAAAASADPLLDTVPPAVVPARPARAAAARTPSVVVSAPGRPRSEPAASVPRDPAPVPPPASGITVEAAAPAPDDVAPVPADVTPDVGTEAAPTPEPAPAPRPSVGGNVRVITPPSPPPRS